MVFYMKINPINKVRNKAMKSTKVLALVLMIGIVAMLSIGCATTHVTKMDSTKREPTTNIDIYTDKADVKVPYKQIAILNAEGGELASQETVMKSLINQAKKLGANGIIYGGEDSKTKMSTLGGFSASTVNTAKAIAIVYTPVTP